ncbi:UDP-forming cellulose synthase catalytic subunit [Xanthomonas massiliensis]|uniref:UDP-forming cellulose synthase catalytic subunit n=1 Tax=Xanthomonas massiliensis TaxID=1720302 RepID=UPI000826EDDB|nr:UDP-forming cellulose synthase catalytic subunit [Xanthomonas massiliensis]
MSLATPPLSSTSLSIRLVSWSLWLLAAILLVFVVAVPMDVLQQTLFSLALFIVALVLRRRAGRISALVMMAISVAVSSRYIWWRLTQTVGVGSFVDLTLGLGLLAAELYAFLVLVLGYFQVLWPLRRSPLPLPQDQAQWPSVDVFIPTYNEPLSVVRDTVLAATVIDWPADKINVYVLDDGRRDEFREFCEQAGVNYLTRSDNAGAKAGNINAALKRTGGEYVAIFDCDHIPTRSFLQVTMGWFLRDPKLAVMQMPHYFFSPDPFERNLGTYRRVPNEGELFYGLLQDGNDQWNATFFCGSCAVIRRAPLAEIGGVATDTVTEDAHTALKLHRAGYRSGYIAIPQAAGLATESLSAHVAQRIRWARGMAQIFRVDNPLGGRGLRLSQRLCYFNAMLHFFYGLPRIVYLTAPLAYLFFGAHVIHASALMIVAYAFPHVLQAGVTNLRMQGKFRHPLWNEVYETTLAWYILRPTWMALLNPRLGKFNVTPKGGLVERGYFDAQIARPYLLLMVLNLAGIAAGILRLLAPESVGEVQTVWFNLAWTLYNVLILGATIATASEHRQVRKTPRVPLDIPVVLYAGDGQAVDCRTVDFSSGGMGVSVAAPAALAEGQALEVGLTHRGIERRLPAVVRRRSGTELGLKFGELDVDQQRWLVASTFARADVWVSLWGVHEKESFWRALGDVAATSLRGFHRLGRHIAESVGGGYAGTGRGKAS